MAGYPEPAPLAAALDAQLDRWERRTLEADTALRQTRGAQHALSVAARVAHTVFSSDPATALGETCRVPVLHCRVPVLGWVWVGA